VKTAAEVTLLHIKRNGRLDHSLILRHEISVRFNSHGVERRKPKTNQFVSITSARAIAERAWWAVQPRLPGFEGGTVVQLIL
jgi:hypothetical protein